MLKQKEKIEMAEIFGKYNGAMENTLKIAERCNVEFEFGKTLLNIELQVICLHILMGIHHIVSILVISHCKYHTVLVREVASPFKRPIDIVVHIGGINAEAELVP